MVQMATVEPAARPEGAPLRLEWVRCNLCGADDSVPVAVGEDFEYRTSADTFVAVRCRRCQLVYLNPRPLESELERLYPPDYHAYDFSEERFGLVHEVRRRLEAHRLLRWCRGLADGARILDVGCGDGFHLRLLREFGSPTWSLEGVDPSPQAVAAARRAGLKVHRGTIERARLQPGSVDLALLVMTIEHVTNPAATLSAVARVLRPEGRVVVVTDNVGSPDFRLFGGRHWGGYHFPRHLHLFDPSTLSAMARKVGLHVDCMETAVSPVNWTYSVRNLIDDWGGPRWLVDRFSLSSPVALGAFTAFDWLQVLVGRGAILNAVLRRPGALASDEAPAKRGRKGRTNYNGEVVQ
jgi:SAM-dependent methyltransferase